MYDLSTNQEKQLTREVGNLVWAKLWPDIDQNIVVWTDGRERNWSTYMYNLTSNQEKKVVKNLKDQ